VLKLGEAWGTKYYRIIHEPLLSEWLTRTYPPFTWRTNVRLGVPRPEILALAVTPELRRMVTIVTPSVDALVLLADKTVIVEAMVRDAPGKIEELKLYKQLLLQDPKFKHRWTLPVELILLTPIINPLIKIRCEAEGIRYEIYRPEWIIPYLETLPPRIASPRAGGTQV